MAEAPSPRGVRLWVEKRAGGGRQVRLWGPPTDHGWCESPGNNPLPLRWRLNMKHCPGCGESKPFSEFYTLRGMADGYRKECKPCFAERRKIRKEELGEFPIGPFLPPATAVPRLYQILHEEEAWKRQAECAGESDEIGSYDQFFADETGNVNQLMVTKYTKCVKCPVAFECLEYSNRIEARDGVWGGLTGDTRRQFLNRFDLREPRARFEHAAILRDMVAIRERQKVSA